MKPSTQGLGVQWEAQTRGASYFTSCPADGCDGEIEEERKNHRSAETGCREPGSLGNEPLKGRLEDNNKGIDNLIFLIWIQVDPCNSPRLELRGAGENIYLCIPQ